MAHHFRPPAVAPLVLDPLDVLVRLPEACSTRREPFRAEGVCGSLAAGNRFCDALGGTSVYR